MYAYFPLDRKNHWNCHKTAWLFTYMWLNTAFCITPESLVTQKVRIKSNNKMLNFVIQRVYNPCQITFYDLWDIMYPYNMVREHGDSEPCCRCKHHFWPSVHGRGVWEMTWHGERADGSDGYRDTLKTYVATTSLASAVLEQLWPVSILLFGNRWTNSTSPLKKISKFGITFRQYQILA